MIARRTGVCGTAIPRFVLLLVLPACGARTGLQCPVLDGGTLPSDASDTVNHADDATAADATCSVSLRVDSTDVPLGCVIDLRVGHLATLSYPCGGGPAQADFSDDGGSVFSGTVSSAGQIDLALDTMFRPGDGCLWDSHQTIVGLVTGSITYTYAEMPAPGETGCLPPCPVSRAVLAVGDAGSTSAPDATSGETETVAPYDCR